MGYIPEDAFSFNLINQGALIEEFPSSEDFIDTKEKLYGFDKLRENVPGISASVMALGLHALQHRGQEGCGIVV